jgi:glycosyltransferase involved in cell wall biosynthesis
MASEFDVELFSFVDQDANEAEPLLEFCARVVLVGKPRYREPRWSSLLPADIHEFRSAAMRQALAAERREFGFELLQVEYTQLAEYGGDVMVEHDITFDLFGQIARRDRTLSASWDYLRWQRFESRAVRWYRSVVVMSGKDAELIGSNVPAVVIENGVDLNRFVAAPEKPGEGLLFIGSFRHFPNIAAYRFFMEQVWPLLRDQFPFMTVTVVCGPDRLMYWRAFTDSPEPRAEPRLRLLGFVADVRPLYVEANLVLVPTPVSAGTNVKVLEAMAMQRAVVSTSSGCAGLGLVHSHSSWIADTAEDFASGIATLMADSGRRRSMALAAYEHAVRDFDWRVIGEKQRKLFRDLLRAQQIRK